MDSTQDKVSKTFTINRDTLIPAGIVVVLVGAAVWLNGQLLQISFRLENIERDIATHGDDRWRGQDMKNWAILLQAQNPDLHVPEVVPGTGQ